MNVGLPWEIFINDKLERFAFIALVYWDAVYMNVYCVVIYRLQNSRFLDLFARTWIRKNTDCFAVSVI